MAKYKLPVPPEVHAAAEREADCIDADMASERLPEYHEFVNNLMKEMPTVADELHHACTGIAGEAGELLDLSKKVWANNKPLDIKHLIEELGDLRFYYQALLNMLDMTDEEIRASNVTKLRKRYADGKYSDAQAHAQADKAPGADRKFMGNPANILRDAITKAGGEVDNASFKSAARELEKDFPDVYGSQS